MLAYENKIIRGQTETAHAWQKFDALTEHTDDVMAGMSKRLETAGTEEQVVRAGE